MGHTYPTVYPFILYTGNPVSADIASLWPASLNGRNYMLDTANENWRHRSIPLLKPQQDNSTQPAETSLNPDILWRRAQDSFHGGAGQTFRDRDGGSGIRFRSSKGVDPWEFWELSLLNDTTLSLVSAETNNYLVAAGERLYAAGGTAVKYTTNLSSWSTVTSTSGQPVTALASDGFNVWIGNGSDGIYATDTGASSAASYATGTVDKVAYVKGRLMASAGPAIYNVVTGGALPAALFTQNSSAFEWVGFAEGLAHIFAAGFSGDKSLIYRIAVKPDASSLDQPIICGELGDGEIIQSIGGYLGFIFLGTSLGVRFCQVDPQGNLNIGAVFGPASPLAFEGQETFVWFGWTDFDTTSTGLGRLDLRTFTENTVTGARVPAYASDLMASMTGDVTSVATFLDVRVFGVAGDGFYVEDTTSLVDEGVLSTGEVGFGIPDEKILLTVDIRTTPLVGSYAVELAVDSGTFTSIGSEDTAGDIASEFPISDGTGQHFEIRITLSRDGMTLTEGPTLTRWTLKASPGGTDTPAEYLFAPIELYEFVTLPGGQIEPVDVPFELENLKELRRTRAIVVYQEAQQTYTVQCENFDWSPENFTTDVFGNVTSPNGVMLMQLKRIQ